MPDGDDLEVDVTCLSITDRIREAKGWEVSKCRGHPAICWSHFLYDISCREILDVIKILTADTTVFYIGLSRSPIWRYQGSSEHAMMPHRFTYAQMVVLSAWNRSYGQWVERCAIRHFKCSGRCANKVGGGSIANTCDELTPVFLYVCFNKPYDSDGVYVS